MSDDAGTDQTESGPAEAPPTEPPRAERPTAEAPSADVPMPDTPTTDASTLQQRYSQVDPEFRLLFWKLVLVYKVAIIGLTLGLLLVGFGERPDMGRPLAAGGAALFVYGLYLTRRGKARLDAGEYDLSYEDDASESATDDASEPATDEGAEP